MEKIKLTKGELKKQRDSLKQYQRYLPTLQLKKQQIQIEILRQVGFLEQKKHEEEIKTRAIEQWLGLLAEGAIDLRQWVRPQRIITGLRNIAGVELPVFEAARFLEPEYDLFYTPPWVDAAIIALQAWISLREEIAIIEKGIGILRQELRVITQRVNLFEKVKIPEAEEAIRAIKIYISDQMANAVGRSKFAKKKIEALELTEALV